MDHRLNFGDPGVSGVYVKYSSTVRRCKARPPPRPKPTLMSQQPPPLQYIAPLLTVTYVRRRNLVTHSGVIENSMSNTNANGVATEMGEHKGEGGGIHETRRGETNES